MDDSNFYTVQGWMVNKLKLSGNKLICFAIIYGFSQDGKSTFDGSYNYIADFISCSLRSVIQCLSDLRDLGFIDWKSGNPKDNSSNVYWSKVSYKDGEIIDIPPGAKIAQGLGKNEPSPSAKFAPNNNRDTYKSNYEEKDISSVPSDISKEKKPTKRFNGVRPSKEEVEAYIRDKGYHVSYQEMDEYYTAHGSFDVWRFINKPGDPPPLVRDWKGCCSTFESNWKKRNRRMDPLSMSLNDRVSKEDLKRMKTVKVIGDWRQELGKNYKENA